MPRYSLAVIFCAPFIASIAVLPPASLDSAQVAKYTTSYGLSNKISHFHILQNSSAQLMPFGLGGPRTNATFPLSEANDLEFQCSSEDYGTPLPAACSDAYKWLPMAIESATFGDRSNGENYDVVLPWRIISADGTCFIEVTYSEPGASDRELIEMIKFTAFRLVSYCVTTYRSGGIARGLGQNGKLVMTVQQYTPNVHCSEPSGNLPDYDRCQSVITDMPAGLEVLKFGKHGTPGIDVALTTAFSTPDRKCVLKVGIDGLPKSARWYDFYGAAVAVLKMCISMNKEGFAFLRGQSFVLKFENQSPRLSLPGATA